MVAATSEQFIDRLRESGLLSGTELDEARQVTEGLADSREIARRLVSQGLLSRWQPSKVLAAKLPFLGEAGAADLPLFNARWRALLRSLASLENYRAVRGADMDAREVQRFLLFETSAPRSVRCGVERILRYLSNLPRASEMSEADRILGRFQAELTYDEERILDKDVATFCTELVEQLTRVHESIAADYFPG